VFGRFCWLCASWFAVTILQNQENKTCPVLEEREREREWNIAQILGVTLNCLKYGSVEYPDSWCAGFSSFSVFSVNSTYVCLSTFSLKRNPLQQFWLLMEPMGVARNWSWGPKFEAEGREWGRGSLGGGSEPPLHQLWSLGERCKLFQQSSRPEMHFGHTKSPENLSKGKR